MRGASIAVAIEAVTVSMVLVVGAVIPIVSVAVGIATGVVVVGDAAVASVTFSAAQYNNPQEEDKI